ncbi:DUF6705 family protein [Flavobacterium sp. RHBU_24]|uniref:DUF6705 family protein n=1 Tax=Flavobacterium sp. RHBU_24 TaxID=3391185 RepID=UPI003984A18C
MCLLPNINKQADSVIKIYFLILLFIPLSAIAQVYQTTKPLENMGEIEHLVYYKDMNNVLNGFEGAYEYTGPGFYFKMELKKIFSNVDYFCEDVLVGKYRYIKDGVDIDYMSDNLIALPNDTTSKISLSWIHPAQQPLFCPQCLSEKWIEGGIFDPVTDKGAVLRMAKRTVGSQQGVQVWLHLEVTGIEAGETEVPIQLPISNFFMAKIQ